MDMAQYTTELGTIRKSDIENINIPIPSNEVQEYIVKECDYYDNLIDVLKKENERLQNNKIIELLLNSVSPNDLVV
jgi:restriction endonuclease S subunit